MTPDDLPALFDEARDEPAFSGSDEGYAFMAAFCDVCVHDKSARAGDDGNGCPLVLITLTGLTPAQFVTAPDDQPHRYRCTEFRREGEPDPEPRAIPDPPGQDGLVPRDEFTGVRMLTALPAHEEVGSRG